MSTAERRIVPFTPLEQLREGRAIVRQEAAALETVADRLDGDFCAALDLLATAPGRVIVTGMGKAGHVARKLAATLASTGRTAHFLHPAEAIHGDVGCLAAGDVLLALSNSGETDELTRLLPIARRLGASILAITAAHGSTLGREADVTIALGRLPEAGPYGLAPSTTTTAMLAVGDALALVLARINGFSPAQFAVFHPGGSLGRKLARVSEVMRQGDDLRIACETATIREVFVRLGKPGRRTGAVMLVDAAGRLTGLFTDSDLARLLESADGFDVDRPIHEVMTRGPRTTIPEATLSDVADLLAERKLSELPVVDADDRPIGLVDITDVIGLLPHSEEDGA
jgi:arabinose-5-phosphate isomerase